MHYNEEEDNDASTRTPTLFKLRSWGDVFAIMSLFGMLLAGLMWGLKLESRYDTIQQQSEANRAAIAEIKETLKTGILPVTAERLNTITNRDIVLTERVDNLERNCFEAGRKENR